MKKYAATLLSVLLVCGCSNITPNNEKVEASQEKLQKKYILRKIVNQETHHK